MKLPKVALALASGTDYAGLLKGIGDYVSEHQEWDFYFAGAGFNVEDLFNHFRPDGLIARTVDFPVLGERSGELRKPMVDVSSAELSEEIPQVKPDDEGVGRLVGEYLLERGFRAFGYLGPPGMKYSMQREKGFRAAVEGRGFNVSSYRAVQPWWDYRVQARPERSWIKGLPKPVGVMASDDRAAQHFLLLCRRLGVFVPDEVAVVSVNNDEGACGMVRPTLSSVPLDTRRAGYMAAGILDGLMHGNRPPVKLVLVPPLAVVTRQSSDVLAMGDAEVRTAVAFIRNHSAGGMRVEDVVATTTVCRRALEMRYKRAMGRTIRQEISRMQVERAKKLLLETDWAMPKIARACGFKTAQWMSAVFGRQLATPPTAYRKRARVP